MKMGVNQRRLPGGVPTCRYTYQDLLNDLAGGAPNAPTDRRPAGTHTIQVGDLVYSLTRDQLAPVSAATAGKVLTQNFIRWQLVTDQVTPQYLCYCLNQSPLIAQQLGRLRGSSPTAKLSLGRLQQLDVPILPLTEQRLWGQLYLNLQRQRALRQRLTTLQTQLLRGMDLQTSR